LWKERVMVTAFVSGGGLALAGLAVRCFSIWWRTRAHRQNVDRVLTSAERLAAMGQPMREEVAAAIRAIQPEPRVRFAVGRVGRLSLDSTKEEGA
jgi:hypothetical protein